MDLTPKRQAFIIGILVLGLIGLWFTKQDPQINQLNAALRAESDLLAYPYQFRVMAVKDGVATLTTPRSAQVSVLQFFPIAFPKLDLTNPDSPAVIAAQKDLARVQEKASHVIKQQPGIKDITWEIDRDWYASHGLIVP